MFPAIISLVTSALSYLPGAFGDYFKKKQELQQIELEGKIALQKANIELSAKIAESQATLTTAIVNSTGAYFKYFTFTMWFGPFMIGTIRPSLATEIFNNWDMMPDWYIQSCVAIMFTIWGIQVSAPAVNTIFERLSSYLDARRKYKVEKIKAKFNEKAYLDMIRAGLFPKGMTQDQVDLFLRAKEAGIKGDE